MLLHLLRPGQALALAVDIKQGGQQQQSQHTDGRKSHRQPMTVALTALLILVGDIGEQRRDLPVALTRTIAVGTLTGETDITIGTVYVALQHQLVGQFPKGALVHHSIAYISQGRLHQPVHHLYGVVLRLKL